MGRLETRGVATAWKRVSFRTVATDDDHRRSKQRAKTSGLVLAGMGLNALLPGAGTLSLRLGDHIVDLMLAGIRTRGYPVKFTGENRA